MDLTVEQPTIIIDETLRSEDEKEFGDSEDSDSSKAINILLFQLSIACFLATIIYKKRVCIMF